MVDRYTTAEEQYGVDYHEPAKDGAWVEYSDYAALEAEKDRAWRHAKVMAKKVDTLESENARYREALAQYADKENWGYYDESGCPKGAGDYIDACFIGPQIATQALGESDGAL